MDFVKSLLGEIGKTLTLSRSREIARDIGAGITANITAPARKKHTDQAFAAAENILNLSKRTKDPKAQQQMFRSAQNIFSDIGRDQKNIQRSFSPNAEKHPLERGATLGLEVGTLANILSSVVSSGAGLTTKPTMRPITASTLKQQASLNIKSKELEAIRLLRQGVNPKDIARMPGMGGEIQKALFRQKGLGLMADFENATQTGNLQLMKSLATAAQQNPIYQQFLPTMMARITQLAQFAR